MMLTEFERLTGIYPTMILWEVIEQEYGKSELPKQEWCKSFAENKDGMAERIARAADAEAFSRSIKLQTNLGKEQEKNTALESRIEELQKQLDKELRWRPAKDLGTNMSEHDYQILADDEAPLSELDAIRRVAHECGFDMSQIKIISTVETFDVNKYRKCRVSGKYNRQPVWSSSDWNYIRFECANLQWEIVNGELMPYYD